MQPQPVLCSHATNPPQSLPSHHACVDVFMRVKTIGYTQENVRCQLLASVGRAQARQISELVHKISKGKKFYAPCTKFLLFKRGEILQPPMQNVPLITLHNIPPIRGGLMVVIEIHYVFPYCRGESLRWPTQNLSPLEVYFRDFISTQGLIYHFESSIGLVTKKSRVLDKHMMLCHVNDYVKILKMTMNVHE